ncbi:HIRAN domain-containing protein [Campylobacter sp. JMF_01 NE2]|uniref:HIRAN domain-containing protein n=1 Tax=unclassified Campylobacter TaxID=2593542 RepID=UPI001B71AEE2|nr:MULTISPECIES: HIRAN domain-containing protein [unclassified Campylobacter]MBP3224150.1 HIRAN domain-containing protein [Campylobacter sp.]MDA3043310.1 HIRAN domain-containing protein [Campylobacter sp. JMF_09 ED2]MDA3045001.1 HIRAN domain-containing protein [Campylobacter sp. JMF_07 ED4]MDA3045578.1 HIRAN domain-containing protein [Campylobacter sp. VBCF_06 NA8]MDA3050021.1 HIRAN domain-containing protein [Campylobacter sp. JMF_15 NE4]
MKKIYFTITGLNFYYGWEFLKENMVVNLEKEPDNKYDREAIVVKLEGFGKIGYVANSTKTVIGESMSAGRLYDKFKKKAKGKVLFASERGVICRFKG